MPALATNFVMADQHATPYRLISVDTMNLDSIMWYPAASFAEPNHFTHHKFMQASMISSLCMLQSYTKPLNYQSHLNWKGVLLYLSILLITQSHDTEMNPGPYTPKYPCGVCLKAVRWSRTRTAVACDTCNTWYHTDCMGMSSGTYKDLNRSDVTWICMNCDTPNHSSSLLDSYIVDSENRFQVLSSIDNSAIDSSNTSSICSTNTTCSANASVNSDIGPPLQQSSPIKKTTRKNTTRPLKVLSANLQSMKAKRESFWEAVEASQPDVIIANETWLKPDLLNSEMMPPGYNSPIRKDRADGYGGVLLATKGDLIDGEIQLDSDCEIIATKVEMVKQQPLIIISAYRPPKNDLPYAQNLCQAIRQVVTKYPAASFWISGDFNLPDINWATEAIIGHQYTIAINNCFLSTFHDLGLSQIVDFPTRINSTLDLFLTNRPSLVSKCIPLPGVSDHEMVLTISDIRTKRQKPARRLILLWKKADMAVIKSQLHKFTTSFVSANTVDSPVNSLWNQISTTLHGILEEHVPSKMTSTRFNQPWINNRLKSLSRRKMKAYKKAKKSNSPKDWSRYKLLKKTMQYSCRKTYDSFICDMICGEMSSNPKKFWSYIKSKRCDNSGVAPLMKDGILQSDSTTKANLLNDQFVSAFTNEDSADMPILGSSPHPEVPMFQIGCEGVQKLLSNLKPHTAAGPDNLPAYLLKEGAEELAPALTLLFQATLHQGKIPHEWKSAYVTPIFKKGDKHQPANYRPISLTSIVCKLMEHIMHSQIINHLNDHGLLTDKQFGFRKKHWCDAQLLLTVHDLASGLRDQEQIDAILLDFSKAFDKVPHERLLLKLHFYGIRGSLLSWIRDFLTNRTQQVILEGKKSNLTSVTSGVPQGTVLGPLLFLIFINDLPEYVTSEIRLFADDCLLYRPIKTQADVTILQHDLSNLQEWERKWLMSFNPAKCEVLRVTNKKKNIITADYSIHGSTLRTVDEAKYLGVTIQSNLSWKPHINNICKKSNSTLGFLRRNLRKSPSNIKEQAYKTYVRPTLEYSSTVWDPHTKDLSSKIDMVQRRAARFVLSDYHPRHSVTQMLNKLQWQTLSERRAHSKTIMLYRIVHGLVAIPCGPPYFHPSTCGATRGHHLQFRQHHCRIQSYQYSFFPSAICLWNVLPASVVSAPSLEAFRSRLSPLQLR
ncbi:uncharacterized protein [Amphiura filiformis]|uniref:uncharacterized protein n=1 Tax=Amphiura filiformis TaxID=82378 RepID=UPI003B20EBD4